MTVDILVALNKESIDLHQKELASEGVIVFDSDKIKDVGSDNNVFAVPLQKLAEKNAKNKLMANTVALGAALGLAGYDLQILSNVLREHFGAVNAGEANAAAATAGYEYTKTNFKGYSSHRLSPISDSKKMLLAGSDCFQDSQP